MNKLVMARHNEGIIYIINVILRWAYMLLYNKSMSDVIF